MKYQPLNFLNKFTTTPEECASIRKQLHNKFFGIVGNGYDFKAYIRKFDKQLVFDINGDQFFFATEQEFIEAIVKKLKSSQKTGRYRHMPKF